MLTSLRRFTKGDASLENTTICILKAIGVEPSISIVTEAQNAAALDAAKNQSGSSLKRQQNQMMLVVTNHQTLYVAWKSKEILPSWDPVAYLDDIDCIKQYWRKIHPPPAKGKESKSKAARRKDSEAKHSMKSILDCRQA